MKKMVYFNSIGSIDVLIENVDDHIGNVVSLQVFYCSINSTQNSWIYS
jgi:hypothetical protein